MRGRILLLIAVFAIVGAMLNVAVAWTLGARGGVRELASYQVTVRSQGSFLPVTWLCRRARAFGLDHVVFVGGGAFGIGQGQTPEANEHLLGWPRWAPLPPAGGPAARKSVTFVAAGWPARSLVARRVNENATWADAGPGGGGAIGFPQVNQSGPAPVWEHAIVVGDPSAGGPFSARLLPSAPIALGFVANTAFWGGGAYALFACAVGTGRLVRGRSRRRAGRCPTCDYELHGALASGCPECGWRR